MDATENLVIALQHLRHPDHGGVLWIDALCINQTDNVEKSSQVLMMGDVFAQATRVVVWLGPARHASDVAFAFINRRFDFLLRSPRRIRDEMDRALNRRFGIDSAAVERRLALLDADGQTSPRDGDSDQVVRYPESQEHGAILMVLRRDWWTRIWVTQELCLGKEAIRLQLWSSDPPSP